MKIKNLWLIILFFNISSNVSAQFFQLDTVKSTLNTYNQTYHKTNYSELNIIGGSSLIAFGILHNYQYQSWWKSNSKKIQFENSFNSNNWINKTGKFFSTNLIAHFYSASLEGAGIEYEKATIYSAAIALTYGLYVETFDGFSKDYKFNSSEMIFDLLGAGYVLGQYYIPELKNFQPRISYYPSDQFLSDEIKNKNILSDFGGQKYWLGIRIKEYLPKYIKDYWPSFLMVSIGMGVNKFENNQYNKNEFYIALDLDAEEIPLYGEFWQFIKNTLNYLHFPLPGIRITPNTSAFLFTY